MTELSRRSLITTGGVALLGSSAVVLAACAPGQPGTGGRSPDDSAQLPAGTELALAADIPVGGTAAATVDGHEILLARPAEGTVVAFSAICTHQGCVVAAAPTEFDCPCHGSRFEAATGEVLGGPAVRPLNAIEVTVVDGAVVIA